MLYYSKTYNSGVCGPISPEDLAQLVSQGLIPDDCQVCMEKSSTWMCYHEYLGYVPVVEKVDFASVPEATKENLDNSQARKKENRDVESATQKENITVTQTPKINPVATETEASSPNSIYSTTVSILEILMVLLVVIGTLLVLASVAKASLLPVYFAVACFASALGTMYSLCVLRLLYAIYEGVTNKKGL